MHGWENTFLFHGALQGWMSCFWSFCQSSREISSTIIMCNIAYCISVLGIRGPHNNMKQPWILVFLSNNSPFPSCTIFILHFSHVQYIRDMLHLWRPKPSFSDHSALNVARPRALASISMLRIIPGTANMFDSSGIQIASFLLWSEVLLLFI